METSNYYLRQNDIENEKLMRLLYNLQNIWPARPRSPVCETENYTTWMKESKGSDGHVNKKKLSRDKKLEKEKATLEKIQKKAQAKADKAQKQEDLLKERAQEGRVQEPQIDDRSGSFSCIPICPSSFLPKVFGK